MAQRKQTAVDNGEVPAIDERLNPPLPEVTAKKGKAAADKPGAPESVQIERIQTQLIEIEIVGTTGLLVCAWSHKAKKQMLDKQMKKATRGREAKDPEADYQASRYVAVEGWDGIPAGGIKGCLVNACRATDVPMTLAKRMLFVKGQGRTQGGQELVRIYGTPQKHEAMVRIDNGGSTDIRFRAFYPEWHCKLEIEFLASVISAEQVANLVELAGFTEGLCEHRPGSPKSNTGNNGRFQVRRQPVS